ncbi:predicted protein [Phaeodactylum tricornutum CCAP 1055/1]|jgi:flagellar biosynthesis GTPase FlhF|uniref:Smr domain-containing protein n=2 Tax=Phaeodactylum tricornutum TaxID=2850 RepID=B7GB89_PHATC|nr:predicted protein [Phaeodactylum tricornutum CCAP 1055/1]EEC44074.1 predicted protein [Phaeodactylum tricornutum CCAP 1055/1]|eukprot:XP_002184325.1 predicted protein [Phaeodactylum tricornutum CCAP 1055/1]
MSRIPNGGDIGNLPTLDLHGFRRERAVRDTVAFLEIHQTSWVIVITGSGRHSPEGPVLRGAVESILQRRGMQFSRNTPGTFLVNAATGHSNYYYQDGCAEDTKVVVRDANEEEVAVQLAMRKTTRGYCGTASGRALHRSSSSSGSSENCLGTGPSLVEVARADQELDQARAESLQLVREEASKYKREAKAIRKAVAKSIDEVRKYEDEEEELLRKAVQLSEEQEASEREEEERILREVLRESEKDSKSSCHSDDALREAILRSDCEYNPLASDDSDEASMIRQAIALSLADFHSAVLPE